MREESLTNLEIHYLCKVLSCFTMEISMANEQGVGKAYGFLKSDKDYAMVQAAVNFSNEQSPSGLEITVTEGVDKLQKPQIPEQLRRFANLSLSVGRSGNLISQL